MILDPKRRGALDTCDIQAQSPIRILVSNNICVVGSLCSCCYSSSQVRVPKVMQVAKKHYYSMSSKALVS